MRIGARMGMRIGARWRAHAMRAATSCHYVTVTRPLRAHASGDLVWCASDRAISPVLALPLSPVLAPPPFSAGLIWRRFRLLCWLVFVAHDGVTGRRNGLVFLVHTGLTWITTRARGLSVTSCGPNNWVEVGARRCFTWSVVSV